MKPAILLLLLLLPTCHSGCANELRLDDDFGPLFQGKSLQISWELSTNRVPKEMNIYRVVPARFSFETLSNLVVLGRFKEAARVRSALVPSLRGKDCLFEEEPAHIGINISPGRGLAFLQTRAIPLPGEPETGPPSDEEVLRLAVKIATMLGIKPSELARKPDAQDYLVWRDKRTRGGRINGEYRAREVARGIYLYRAVDGVSFNGNGPCGGLYVNFGNDAKVAQLDFSWRNLERKDRRPTASQDELTRRLRSGKAVIQVEAEPARIERLVITNMVPYYRGYGSHEPQSWVYPFVVIQATAEIGKEKIPASLACPILKD